MTRLALVLLLVACGEKKAPPSPNVASAAKTDPKPDPKPEWAGHVDLAVVDGFKTPSAIDKGVVIVTPTGIVVDGTPIVGLTAGVADPSEREGDAHGLKIPRLTKYLAAYKKEQPLAALPLAFDKAVPYRTFFEIVYSAKQREAGFKDFVLLAKTKQGALAEAPFALPDRMKSDDEAAFADIFTGEGPPAVPAGRRRPGADLGQQIADVKNAGSAVKVGTVKANDKELAKRDTPRAQKRATPPSDEGNNPPTIATMLPGEEPKPDPNMPVKLVVAITKTDVLLWSLSGLEGTLQEPRLKIPAGNAVAPLRGTLEGIVARRWSGKERTEQDILIMAEGDVPMQRVEEVIGAVRADGGGKPLFPDINFSSGFE